MIRIGKTLNYLMIGLIILGAFASFFYLNQITGYTGDDYLYHFLYLGEWPSSTTSGIHNPMDLFISINNHTNLWNGRLVGIFFEQVFMQIPKTAFDLLNSLAYVALGIVLNCYSNKRLSDFSWVRLLMIYGAMFLFLPDFGAALLWVSGASNYLWPTLLYLSFLLPFRWGYKPKNLARFTWLMVLTAILAGSSNETSGFVILFICVVYYLSDKDVDRMVYEYWSMFGVLFGFIFLLAHSAGEASSFKGDSSLWDHFLEVVIKSVQYVGPLALLGFVLLAWQGYHLYQKGQLKLDFHQPFCAAFLFYLGGLGACAELVASPSLQARIWFCSSVMFMASDVILLSSLVKETKFVARLVETVLALALLFFSGKRYLEVEPKIYDNYECYHAAESILLKAQKQGKKNVLVPGMSDVETSYSAFYQTAYMEQAENPDLVWANAWVAKFYNLKTVNVNNDVPRAPVEGYRKVVHQKLKQFR